ncbi:MAG: class I SAM-dependent methyltransferase [Chitinispirillales bacterium]|jgi:SAM-dependent methyltransferase|nr:class I SAM-dependent methyltransferase [Chitinispirillales bacterium]
MYNDKLKIYQRNDESIWTDEYISKSLLENQLDESTNAASRMPSNRRDIVNWINSKIKPNSRIIDLGCGPGLYAYELGKLEHYVMGIDFNKESIEFGKRNKSIKGIVEYKYSDYIKDNIDGIYNVAMMIFCDFSALVPNEQKILLQKISTLLADDGIFIFDVFGKAEFEKQKNGRTWYVSNGNDFWSSEPYFLMKETKLFEAEFSVGTRYYLINQLNGTIKEFIMYDQYHDENSIQELVAENGFDIVEINKDIIRYKEETLLTIVKKKKHAGLSCKKRK